MIKIGINNFVKRQTEQSEFTHFSQSWEDLVVLVYYQFKNGKYSNGYRDGVIVVHIDCKDCPLFKTYTDFPMFEGMKLKAEYRKIAGREHEPPTVVVIPDEPKKPCKYVDVILYRADVLDEDGDRSTDCDWEIVSINGKASEEEVPMSPMTIVRNWKHLPGGTEMKGKSPEEVLEMLCVSIMYQNGIKRQ